jgi:hypothetical protein
MLTKHMRRRDARYNGMRNGGGGRQGAAGQAGGRGKGAGSMHTINTKSDTILMACPNTTRHVHVVVMSATVSEHANTRYV